MDPIKDGTQKDPKAVDDVVAAVQAELGQDHQPAADDVEEKIPEETPPPPPPPASQPSDQEFVVQKIQGYKDQLGFILSLRYGVEIDDEVDRFLHLRPNTVRLLKSNAYWLASKLRETVGDGKGEVILALIAEGWFTMKGMKRFAAKRQGLPPAPAAPPDGEEAADDQDE